MQVEFKHLPSLDVAPLPWWICSSAEGGKGYSPWQVPHACAKMVSSAKTHGRDAKMTHDTHWVPGHQTSIPDIHESPHKLFAATTYHLAPRQIKTLSI